MKNLFVAFAVLFFATFTFAQEPVPASKAKTVIHAAHLLDVKTGKMMDNVSVTVEGDKITFEVVAGEDRVFKLSFTAKGDTIEGEGTSPDGEVMALKLTRVKL